MLLLSDFRYALRSLLATPTSSAIIVLTLALGIGLNTSIFSVVNAVLLRPLPYGEPEALVHIGTELPGRDIVDGGLPGGLFADLATVDTLASTGAFWNIQQNLTGIDVPVQVQIGWVSPGFFTLLRAEPFLGRTFRDDDGPGLAMLSHETWRNSFHEDPEVVGRTVALDGVRATIVGVLPPDFSLQITRDPRRIDVWKTPDHTWANGDVWSEDDYSIASFEVIGRLADGATLQQLRAELDALAITVGQEQETLAELGLALTATPLRQYVSGDVRQVLVTLLAAVGFVLLIACANVVNLLLVRARSRGREIGLRLALGAPRSRVARLLLVESLLLASAGGAAGLMLGAACNRAFALIRPDDVPRLESVPLDTSVLGFVLLATAACTLLVGFAPALLATNRRVADELRSSRGAAAAGTRLTRTLVVAQIGLSLVLLIGAGLLTGSLARLQRVSTGFDTSELLTFSISLPGTDYAWPEGTNAFFRELESRLVGLPGVQAAGLVWPLPLTDEWRGRMAGGEIPDEQAHTLRYRLVTPAFLDTIGVRTLEGRGFGPGDPSHAVLISAALAARAFPDGDAVGNTVRSDPWGRGMQDFQVLGVVGDVRYGSLQEPPSETLYFDSRHWSWVDWEVDFAVRTAVEPLSIVDAVRGEIASMDAEIPMAEVRTMNAWVDEQLAPTRFALGLVGLFAVAAGVLAVIGLYGVLSYSVAERTREIGIRMALGSDPRRILRMVVAQGARLTAVGLTAGVLGALWLTRFLASFLYEIEATDPVTFALVAGSLGAVGLLAAWVPARRATRCDPTVALRTD